MRAANKFRAKQLVAAYASMLSLLLILFLVDAPSASAEGRCPPGQYPIGGQGVGGVYTDSGRGQWGECNGGA